MTDHLGPYELDSIITGDARELAKAIPDESVDLIFTDPPYPREYFWCWGWLAKESARILKPGGSLLAISGKMWLSEILPTMGQWLNYHWIINIDLLKGQGGQAAQVWPRKIIENWKPCLWFQKGEYVGSWQGDHVGSSTNDKHYHKWGQSVGSNIAILQKFPATLTLDPFTGGGTVPAVCKMLGRHYLAFEIDPDVAEKARERVRNTQPPLFVDVPQQMTLDAALD